MRYLTEQEEFWHGEFGNNYIDRNSSKGYLASNIMFFSDVLEKTWGNIGSVIEFGSNIGYNLKAIKQLIPEISCSAVEINSRASSIIRCDPTFENKIEVFEQSILDFTPQKRYDLVLIKGVLIHINPNYLDKVYENIYESSNRYICIAEYYNPTPISIDYRGEKDKLFKRDFAGEVMDKYPSLSLLDYGFKWHRDNRYYDDITWFLLEK